MRKSLVVLMVIAVLFGASIVTFLEITSRFKMYTEGFDLGYVDVYADDLAKRQPADIQKDLKIIFDQLILRSEADLFVLKSSEEPCLLEDLIFCRLISNEKVKPFIEAALAFKQAARQKEDTYRNNLISLGSLCVSFLGLIIAGLSFAYRKKNS